MIGRSVAFAMAAYVDDWGTVYPAWSPPFGTGIESAEDFKCTAEDALYMGGTDLVNQNSPALPQRGGGGASLAAYPTSAAKHPDSHSMFWDMRTWHGLTKYAPYASRQHSTQQVLFLDGHVAAFTRSQIQTAGALWIDFRN